MRKVTMQNKEAGSKASLTEKQSELIELLKLAFCKEALKKIVFSRPTGDTSKITGRLCAHRGRRILALEFSLPGNTVAQRNIGEDSIETEISGLINNFKQVNIISTAGDAEWKCSKNGRDVLLGADKLKRKLTGERALFESAIEALDNKKNYILTGSEDFLIKLGVSDKSGRVHDKRQGKFRQINRFLEHIEDIYSILPKNGELLIYDLCCGKSYLSFAVYHYLVNVKGRRTKMLGIDLKRDVIEWCSGIASELKFDCLKFVCDDITNTPKDKAPDMVISLHACDIATDIVLDTAASLGAEVILSTPCCHRYLNGKIKTNELSFVTAFPHLSNKMCEAVTDSLRLMRMRAYGYSVRALELTDPDDTPKNTLLRAVREVGVSDEEISTRQDEYAKALAFLLGEEAKNYLSEIK